MEIKLIRSNEGRISAVQFIGFTLICLGIIYCIIKLFWPSCLCGYSPLHGDKMAIAFFVIMLGVSFAFPDLLQDQTGGLSTMRIVVFMMINVVCILMLKTGWNAILLGQLTIDPYFMGVIAFVFGAKATQSYFESKLATPTNTSTSSDFKDFNSLSYDEQLKLAQNARDANIIEWKHAYPNIKDVQAGQKLVMGKNTGQVALIFYVSKKSAQVPDNTIPTSIFWNGISIPTDIQEIKSSTALSSSMPVHTCASMGIKSPGCSISELGVPNNSGSIGFMATSQDYGAVIVTCLHVAYIEYIIQNNGNDCEYDSSIPPQVLITSPSFDDRFGGNTVMLQLGFLRKGLINPYVECAIVQLNSIACVSNSIKASVANLSGFLTSSELINGTVISFIGRSSGYVSGSIIKFPADPNTVNYSNTVSKTFLGLIELQVDNVDPGDSGGLVYNDSGQAVGILLSKDDSRPNIAYAIPAFRICNYYGLTI